MHKNRTMLIFFVVGVFLNACGGAGEEGQNGSGDSSGLVKITTANAQAVSAKVIQTAFAPSELAIQGLGASIVAGAVIEVLEESSSLMNFLFVQARKTGVNTLEVGSNIVTDVDIDVTKQCLISGSYRITGEVATSLDAARVQGDRLSTDYDNCVETPGRVVDGRFSIIYVRTMQASQESSFSLETSMQNFTVTQNGERAFAHGDIALRYSAVTTSSIPSTTLTVEGGSLELTASGDTITLSDYFVTQTQDQNLNYTNNSYGILRANAIGGSVIYSTVDLFVGVGLSNPFAGSMVITGVGSSVTLTVVDEVNVSLGVDTNGDGGVDETISTTWSTLNAL